MEITSCIGWALKLPPGAKMPLGADGKPLVIPPMLNLRDNMQEVIGQAVEGGVEWLVCTGTPVNTLDEIKASIDLLNRSDDACKKAGLRLAYHNGVSEFHEVEGKIPYQMLLAETNLKMELDLAWAIKGGQDPVDLFRHYPGRFPLWHVKDMDNTYENILPVGMGTIDYKSIFGNAETAGLEYYFLEDEMPKDAWASITTSMKYLRQLAPVK